ncbi:MAG: hypothetical protein HC836_31205 [Richelia sp. RM2_1_2]|nr:hypothetical protein [Richelia sp. RM2_1_2]
MRNEELIEQAKRLVEAINKTADDNLPETIAEIVKSHSAGAAIAGFCSAWIPGIGAIIASLIGAVFIWSMYSRIGAEIDLPISKNIIKTLLFGGVINFSGYVIGIIVVIILSFIPGLNFFTATVIMAVISYALTLTSGYMYLKIMTRLFNKDQF